MATLKSLEEDGWVVLQRDAAGVFLLCHADEASEEVAKDAITEITPSPGTSISAVNAAGHRIAKQMVYANQIRRNNAIEWAVLVGTESTQQFSVEADANKFFAGRVRHIHDVESLSRAFFTATPDFSAWCRQLAGMDPVDAEEALEHVVAMAASRGSRGGVQLKARNMALLNNVNFTRALDQLREWRDGARGRVKEGYSAQEADTQLIHRAGRHDFYTYCGAAVEPDDQAIVHGQNVVSCRVIDAVRVDEYANCLVCLVAHGHLQKEPRH
jgi:hypothetical protein